MKSKLLNCIWLLMAAMVMTSCVKDDDGDEVTDFEFEEYKFVLVAGPDDRTVTLEFTAKSSWEITLGEADWISVSPKSGQKGPQIVTVSLLPNTTGQDRIVDFMLDSGSETLLTFFVQHGKPISSAQGKAQYDNSAFGLYRGVVVGSSGWIEIKIFNDGSSVSSKVNIDGKTETQTSNYAFEDGKAIQNAVFTGETVSFAFSVNADGQNSVVNSITIVGHDDVSASVKKETSTTPSQAYEGIVEDPQNGPGVFNVVRAGGSFSGIGKGQYVDGTVDEDGNFTGSGWWTQYDREGLPIDVTLTISGKFSGTTVSGTWQTSWKAVDSSGTNGGTFNGKQSL